MVKVSLLLPVPTHHWPCSQLSESHAGTGPGTWEPQSRGSRAEASPPVPAPSSLQPCLIPCTGRQGLLPRSSATAVPFTCPAAHTCVSGLQSHTQLSFGPLWVFSDVSDRVRRAFHGIPYHMACASLWDQHGFPEVRPSASSVCKREPPRQPWQASGPLWEAAGGQSVGPGSARTGWIILAHLPWRETVPGQPAASGFHTLQKTESQLGVAPSRRCPWATAEGIFLGSVVFFIRKYFLTKFILGGNM